MSARSPRALRGASRRVLLGIAALAAAGAVIASAVGALGGAASTSSPGGEIVFGDAASDSLDARIEVASVPARGGAVVPLTDAWRKGSVAAEPRWSPDGRRIVFVVSPRGHLTRYAGDGDVYVMAANGTHVRRLTRGLDASGPAWAPDGSRIVFVEGQGQALAVMRADGSDQHVIAHARGYYEAPAWSPDGRRIAYQSGPDWSSTAIFTIRPDGGGERRLTRRSSRLPGFPAWSPGGRRIAYSAGSQVWLMNSDGSGARRLTNCHGSCVSDFAPAWSPDGKYLVFVQQEDGGAARRLYVLDLATGAVTRLTPNVQWAGSPDWRPVRHG